jgi:aspartate 1-decarboxylase
MIQILRAKLHGIKVTGADLHYHGSITLDPLHCEAAGIYPLEFVDIWNKSSGARLSTYVILGEAGSGCCILNGAAARTCQAGDEIIVAASKYINDPSELHSNKPIVLTFKDGNQIDEILQYDVFESDARKHDFRVVKR